MTLSFFVPGRPAPGGSKTGIPNQYTGKVRYVDAGKGNYEWKATVVKFASEAYSGPPLESALMVRMTFFRLRPKKHFYSGKRSHVLRDDAPAYPTGAPDVLKLARSTEDAMKGVIYKDDAATVDLHIFKRFGDRPGAMVEVIEL